LVSDIIKEEPTAQHKSSSVLGGSLSFQRTTGSGPLNISDPKSTCFLFFGKKKKKKTLKEPPIPVISKT
jgi:hypothetical protein